MKKLLFSIALGSVCVSEVLGAAFTSGNLVVVQVGTGSGALNNTATATSLQEYNTIGSLVQTVNLPTVASGLNQPLTLQGSSTSEGFLTLSTDGQYLTMGGYAAVPGTATPNASTAAAVNRVIGRISMSGSIDTSTSLGDAYSGSSIRSAVSTDGNSIWTGGNAGSGLGATSGARYTTVGSTTSTQLNPTTGNIRVVNIFNGQLYASSASGTFFGISTVGAGLGTTAGGSPLTLLPGMPTAATHSSYDFWFKNASTLYVADDGSAATGGGIQKWVESAGTWSLAYTLLNNGATTTAVRGLAGTLDGSGNAVLYGTTGSLLIGLTDTGAGATATTLATAPANTAFRGVEFLTNVPEPTSAALLLLGASALALRRRR